MRPFRESAFGLAARRFAMGCLLLLASVSRAGADVLPRHLPEWHERRAREDWQHSRLSLGGGPGVPSLPNGWRPAYGWSVAWVAPQLEWLDLASDLDVFRYPFEITRLGPDARLVSPVGEGRFSNVAAGVHLHAPELGARWYGLLELALPDFSIPTVFYDDDRGRHEIAGVEIFGLDPGFVIGAGYEWTEPRKLGGSVELRLIVAPGRTEPTEGVAVLRAGLALPVPF